MIKRDNLINEALYFPNGPRRHHLKDHLDLHGIHLDTTLRDHESKKFVGGDFESTLHRIQLHPKSMESTKSFIKISNMIRGSLTLDEHIINIRLYIAVELILKNFVYQPLISGFCIFQAKGHHSVKIKSTISVYFQVLSELDYNR